jgi:Family of unknown function (DUF6355)
MSIEGIHMSRVKRIAALMMVAATAALASMAVSQPATADAFACGYNGRPQPTYKHCGNSRVWIRVETVIPWEDHYTCFGPWETRSLQYLSRWRVIYAVWSGHFC